MANPTNTEIGEARAVAAGAISRAPLGTALPTDATTALNVAFKGLGYVGAAGITPTRDITNEDVKDMNGDTVYNLQTDFGRTYQAPLLQYDNVDIKTMLFGAAQVVVTAADSTHGTRIAVVDKGLPAAHASYSFDTFRVGATGATKKHREVVPDAQPTAVEFGAMLGGAVRQYTVTWKVFKDSSGNYTYEYDDDGVVAP
jgi:hypothetical protein